MSSLTDLPELIGFFSYSREDDDNSHGALTALRERIQRELRGQLGRSTKTFRLWQDKEAIAPGTLWATEIKNAVAQAVFFIPIITPTVIRSPYCKFELESFLARETELGRSDLVFPILYIKVPELEDSSRQQNDLVLSIIAKRQYLDWREFRHRDVHSTDVKEAVERFCAKICEALDRQKPSTISRETQHEAPVARPESDRPRQDAGAKRGEEQTSGKAADAQAPSNRALLAGSLIGAGIIAAIGAWFVVVRPTSVAVTPTPAAVTAQQVPSAPVTPIVPVPAAPAPIKSTPPAVAPAQPAPTPAPAPIEYMPPAPVIPAQQAEAPLSAPAPDQGTVQSLTICNDFRARIHVAFAYLKQRNFPAAGWWSVEPNACQPVDLPFQGSTLYYSADSDDYKDGRSTSRDHWGNKLKLFVSENKFDLDDAGSPRRGATDKMFSSYELPQQYLGKPMTITFHFITGNTTINITTKQ